MSTPGGELIGSAEIDVDMDVSPAQHALRQLSRDANGRLRDVQERFVSAGESISGSLQGANDRSRGFGLSLGGLGRAAGSVGSSLARVGVSIGTMGAAAGAALPVLAGVVAAVQNIAPAGAVAVTGLLAVKQATLAVKLGMVGVQKAVQAAMDPSDPKAFAEALKVLAPEAQKFAKSVQTLQPQLKALQQGVQNELFLELGNVLEKVASSVLPVLQTNLQATAVTLNTMAKETGLAAQALADSGTLGKALDGANKGLSNLSSVPAQVVTALGQLAAAGAGQFDKLTASAADVLTKVSGKLSAAFQSGALEEAVNTAIGLLKDLGGIVANVFGTLKNVLNAAGAAGGGAFTVLTEITQVLQDFSGTQAFRDAIGALVETVSVLAKTAGPLLVSALSFLGPILTALAGPVQVLVKALGAALQPIIDALGPVLVSLAGTVGSLVEAFAPLLPVVGNLIASLLPPLVPIIDLLAETFDDLAPLIEQVGELLAETLAPVIDELPSIIDPLLEVFSELVSTLLPVLSDLLVQLAPSFAELSAVAGELLVALGPLVSQVGLALVQALAALVPVLVPLLVLFVRFQTVIVANIVSTITNVVIPAIHLLVSLLKGDFSGAWRDLGKLVTGVWTHIQGVISRVSGLIKQAIDVIIGIFQYLYDTLVGGSIVPDLVNRIMSLFRSLGAFLGRVTGAARTVVVNTWNSIRSTVSTIVTGIRNAVSGAFTAVSQIASSSFSSVRNTVNNAMTAARTAVSSAVSGIRNLFSNGFSAIGRSVSAALDRVTRLIRAIPGDARRALGNLSSTLFSAGASLIGGFVDGIKSQLGNAKDAVSGVLSDVGGLFPHSPAKEGPFSGRGYPLYSGIAIGEALAEGIGARAAQVEKAVRELVGSASTPLKVSAIAPGLAGVGVAPSGGAVRAVASPTLVTFNATFANNGIIGSRTETLAWLTQALDQLRREGRLPFSTGVAR